MCLNRSIRYDVVVATDFYTRKMNESLVESEMTVTVKKSGVPLCFLTVSKRGCCSYIILFLHFSNISHGRTHSCF